LMSAFQKCGYGSKTDPAVSDNHNSHLVPLSLASEWRIVNAESRLVNRQSSFPARALLTATSESRALEPAETAVQLPEPVSWRRSSNASRFIAHHVHLVVGPHRT